MDVIQPVRLADFHNAPPILDIRGGISGGPIAVAHAWSAQAATESPLPSAWAVPAGMAACITQVSPPEPRHKSIKGGNLHDSKKLPIFINPWCSCGIGGCHAFLHAPHFSAFRSCYWLPQLPSTEELIPGSQTTFKPMRPRSRDFLSSGFTLTELLVVIVIIAIISALSLLGIRRMRDMADKSSAIRSLSQLQLANMSYATDNAGKYVPKQFNGEKGERLGWWFQVPEFLNYLRGEVTGPDGLPSKTVSLSFLDPKVVRARRPFYDSIAGSFGINETGVASSGGVANARHAHTVATVTEPSQSMAFASATDLGVQYRSRLTWFSRMLDNREGKTTTGDLAYRHGDKIIVVYFDGHVGELSKFDILEIDKNKAGARSAFWKPDR